MKKTLFLVMITVVVLSGCAPKAYWKEGTSYKEAKEDVDRCYAKTVDAWKEGVISWDSQSKQYLDECMRKKGYVLRNKEEAYPLKFEPTTWAPSSKVGAGATIATPNDEWVYVSTTSGLYHRRPCPNVKAQDMGSTRPMKLNDAIDRGYKPCPECIK
jgi:hypothetical protein